MKNKSISVLIGLFTVLAFALCNSSALAQIPKTHWTDLGAPNPDWFLDHNWDNGVPDKWTDAYIDDGGQALINTDPTGGLGAAARTLYLGFGQGDSGSLQVDGFLNYLGIFPDCASGAPGAIYVGYQGSGSLAITNSGTVLTTYGYIAALQNPTRPNSSGSVKMEGPVGPCPIPGVECPSIWHLKNEGCSGAGIYIGCTAPCTPASGQGGTGLLDLGTNSLLEVEGNNVDVPAVNVGFSGTLSGSGFVYLLFGSTATSDTVNVLGSLAPTGGLTIHGNLTLYGKATTTFNVTPQATDSVKVCGNAADTCGGVEDPLAGNANLDGHVSVTMTGTFTPDSTINLLHATAGLHQTKFDTESIKYPGNQCYVPEIQYDYPNNNVNLYLKPTCTSR